MQAYLVDKFGPRPLISAGALMAGAGWVLSAYVENIWALYLAYGVICGFGTGIIYVGIIGLMVRWFPDRRGLATGLAVAGYGFGAIFTSFPIDSMIKSAGYAHTLVVWGIIQGAIGIIAAQWLRIPPEGWLCASGTREDAIETQLAARLQQCAASFADRLAGARGLCRKPLTAIGPRRCAR
jgi:MFS transporter, OFA family, oxalate/formate antiporter